MKFLPATLAALALVAVLRADAPPEVARLIADLGSSSFQTRQAATKALRALGEKALPALREASRSTDLEVKRRARTICNEVEERIRERAIALMLKNVNQEGLDRLIALMATRQNFARDEHWEVLLKTIKAMTERSEELSSQKFHLPELDWKTCPLVHQPGNVVQNSRLLVSDLNQVRFFHRCLVICNGDLNRMTSCSQNILLVNGDVKGFTSLNNSFVFCTGKVGRITGIRNSVIICAGGFEGATRITTSLIQAPEIGRSSVVEDCSIVGLKEVQGGRPSNKFVEAERGPLGICKLFTPAYWGISLDAGGRLDQVQGVFARAGFRKGDRIKAAGSLTLATPADLQRYLRSRLAGDDEELVIDRDGKEIKLPIQFAR